MTFEILFKEPVKIEAETAEDAVVKFAEMFERSMNMNDWFYADDRNEVQRDKDELAEFFMDHFDYYIEDVINDIGEEITEENIRDIAYRGVEYWFSGDVDGTQFDCLVLGADDWTEERENT